MTAQRQRIHKLRILLPVIVAIIGLLVLFTVLTMAQSNAAMTRQHGNSQAKLATAHQLMVENNAAVESAWERFDWFTFETIDTIAWLMDESPALESALPQIAEQWGVNQALLIAEDGRILSAYCNDAQTAEEAGLQGLLDKAKGSTDLVFETLGDTCYYLTRRADGTYMVCGMNVSKMNAEQKERLSPAYSLKNIRIGKTGYIIAISTNDNTIAYAPDKKLIGEDASLLGMANALVPGQSGWVTYKGKTMQFENLEITVNSVNYLLVALVEKDEIIRSYSNVVWSIMLVCALTLLLIIVYAVLLERDRLDGKLHGRRRYFRLTKNRWLDLTTGKSLMRIVAISLVVLAICVPYIHMLTLVSDQSEIFDQKLIEIDEMLERNDLSSIDLIEQFESLYTQRAESIAWSLAMAPELLTDEKLTEFSEKAYIESIDVFDETGRIVATNTVYKDYVLSRGADDPSYPLWDIIKGYQEVYIPEQIIDEKTGYPKQQIAVRRQDEKGIVRICVLPTVLDSYVQRADLNHVLTNVKLEDGGQLYGADPEDSTFVAALDRRDIGTSLANKGITDAVLEEGYIGWQNIDNVNCFVMSDAHGSYILFASIANYLLFSSVFSATILAFAGSLGTIAILLFVALVVSGNRLELSEKVCRKRIVEIGEDSTPSRAKSPKTAGESAKRFSECDAAGKMIRLIKSMFHLLVLLMVIPLFVNAQQNPILSFVFSRRWEHTLNLFSVTYVLYVSVQLLTVSGLIRRIITHLAGMMSSRLETIGYLMGSFIKYATFIGLLFYDLQFFGVDSSTLLASAGILTLVIGLGAQSLVADIIAGLFIVFEGDFRVGDIVTIDTWVGTVEEIDIRTTKVRSRGQDVMILRNSTIGNVINHTRQYSYALAEVGIEYGESLERVEAILARELPHVKQHLPAIIDGPFYKGVVKLDDSAVILRIVAQCSELDRPQLGFDLLRELKLIFDRNDIGIPFPQVVVNRPVEREKANPEEKRRAAEFVREQKKQAQDVHEPQQ